MDDLTRLATAARSGERLALDEFIHAAYDPVWRLCAVLVDDASADDLAQDTIIRVMHALRGFRGEASARTWVLSIAHNTCADELRSRSRQRRRDRQLVENQAREDSTTPDIEDHVGILDMISRLAPDRREAFMLTQVLRLSYDEAAIVCACPRGTIHSRVARARDEMQAMFAGDRRGRADRATSGGDSST